MADHVWQHPYMGGPERAELECYTTLAFLAAHTRRVKLMAIASGVHFRYPGMLAKTATTLDVLSGGRGRATAPDSMGQEGASSNAS